MNIALLLISIVNCTKIIVKVAASFSIILVFFTLAVFYFIFLFWKKSLEWRFKEFKPNYIYTDADIA